MKIRTHARPQLATMYCAPFGGGGDPFSPNTGPDTNNIFNQARQQQQQNSNTMPNGMQQQPPQGATNPAYDRHDQQFRETGATGSQGGDPNDGIINQDSNNGNGEGQSPLDKYRGNSDNGQQGQEQQDPNQQQQQQAQQQQPQEVDYFEVGADKYQQLFSKQDFTQGIDQEQVQKALQGDAEAFMAVLNGVGRNAASNSSFLSSKVASKGVGSRLEKFGQEVPKMVRDQAVNEMFTNNKNKIYSDPATKPVIESIQSMVLKQNPNATASQVQQEVDEYLKAFTGSFAGTMADDEKQESQKGQQQEVDMSSIFG